MNMIRFSLLSGKFIKWQLLESYIIFFYFLLYLEQDHTNVAYVFLSVNITHYFKTTTALTLWGKKKSLDHNELINFSAYTMDISIFIFCFKEISWLTIKPLKKCLLQIQHILF